MLKFCVAECVIFHWIIMCCLNHKVPWKWHDYCIGKVALFTHFLSHIMTKGVKILMVMNGRNANYHKLWKAVTANFNFPNKHAHVNGIHLLTILPASTYVGFTGAPVDFSHRKQFPEPLPMMPNMPLVQYIASGSVFTPQLCVIYFDFLAWMVCHNCFVRKNWPVTAYVVSLFLLCDFPMVVMSITFFLFLCQC
jgi:hypothetical protein